MKTLIIFLAFFGTTASDNSSAQAPPKCLVRYSDETVTPKIIAHDPPKQILPMDYSKHWVSAPIVFLTKENIPTSYCFDDCVPQEYDVIFITESAKNLYFYRKRGGTEHFTEHAVKIDSSNKYFMKIRVDTDYLGQPAKEPRTLYLYYLGKKDCDAGYPKGKCRAYDLEVFPDLKRAEWERFEPTANLSKLEDISMCPAAQEVTNPGTRPP